MTAEVPAGVVTAPSQPSPDEESAAWVAALAARGPTREQAVARLHALLLRAARAEVHRRWAALAPEQRRDLDDLAQQCADDAVVAVLRRLGDYQGRSRFTTWAYKFAVLQTSVALRRRAWHGRELPADPERWAQVVDARLAAERLAEANLLADTIRAAIAALTPHQRDVVVALVIEEVPIDVLADRLGSTRGALYKTLHDARRRIRSAVEDAGFGTPQRSGEGSAR